MSKPQAHLTRQEMLTIVLALEDSATASEIRAVEHARTCMELLQQMAESRAAQKRALVQVFLDALSE